MSPVVTFRLRTKDDRRVGAFPTLPNFGFVDALLLLAFHYTERMSYRELFFVQILFNFTTSSKIAEIERLSRHLSCYET